MAAMDYAKYLRENPDLANHAAAQGLDATAFAKQHWEESGKAEVAAGLRSGSPEMSKAERDEKVEYVRNNPDLRENAEAHGYTTDEAAEMGAWHFETYGKNESRMNEPGNVRLPSAANEVLSSKHFQGRDVEDVLGASVRSAVPSQLWETRAGLGEAAETPVDWSLQSFDPEGWQMAADQYYGQGLLGDEIFVRDQYGQLGSSGDPRFLQDRYEEAAIANDFPAEWVDTSTGQWTGPSEMSGYWNQLTNAIRDDKGLRAAVDLPLGQEVFPDIPVGSYGGFGGGGMRGGGAGGIGAYAPMAAQDWSGIMPQGVFAGSEVQPTQAMQGLVANQGLQYQPWAMPEDTVTGSPFVPQTLQYNAPLNYSPVGGTTATSGGGTTDNGGATTQNQLWWQEPGWDYSGNWGGTAGQPYWMPQGWKSGLDWTSGQLTLDQQKTGWENLAAGKAANPLGLIDGEPVLEYGDALYDTNVTPGWN
jgi:hypothetical protein